MGQRGVHQVLTHPAIAYKKQHTHPTTAFKTRNEVSEATVQEQEEEEEGAPPDGQHF